jgi:glycosyltransferase involved in cell wall biosynthesis
MFSKPCLCSSTIEHAQLLEDGNNVLIVEHDSAQELAEKMAWLLRNPGVLSAIGESGREAYEKLFLMSIFTGNVARLMPRRFQVLSSSIAA